MSALNHYTGDMAESLTPSAGGLRALTRETVRARIADTALVLFDERGFDATTVDDIAAAVGISPRSFFRYFPSKEDTVIGDLLGAGEALRDDVTQHLPAASAWEALHFGIRDRVGRIDSDPERWLRIVRVINSAASLRARNLEKHLAWSALLVPVIAEHVEADRRLGDLAATTLVGMALSCLDAALASWADADASIAFSEVLEVAFHALRR